MLELLCEVAHTHQIKSLSAAEDAFQKGLDQHVLGVQHEEHSHLVCHYVGFLGRFLTIKILNHCTVRKSFHEEFIDMQFQVFY
jgi:hypothetical protein